MLPLVETDDGKVARDPVAGPARRREHRQRHIVVEGGDCGDVGTLHEVADYLGVLSAVGGRGETDNLERQSEFRRGPFRVRAAGAADRAGMPRKQRIREPIAIRGCVGR